jgi:hypothetical protein
MKAICEDIKSHVQEILADWEGLVREEPWYSLPREHRIDSLPAVVVGIVDASLCAPAEKEAHRAKVAAACEHGSTRREQGIPEHLILTEYHLLRWAIWRYLHRKFGPSDRVADAIMRIDMAITAATNASMWGYFRPEVEAQGKWEEAFDRIVASSPFLAAGEER